MRSEHAKEMYETKQIMDYDNNNDITTGKLLI